MDDNVRIPKHDGVNKTYLCCTYCFVQVLALYMETENSFEIG